MSSPHVRQDGTPEPGPEMDLETARLILADADSVRDRLEPDSRLLFGVWGVAWLVGYLLLWFTAGSTGESQEGIPAGWAFAVFGGLLMSAIVVTIVHISRRSRGLRGDSARTGAMFGWIWAVAFAVVFLVITGLRNAGVEGPAMALVSNALPSLVVGVLYMAGAATYRDVPWFVLGAWIALVGGGATLLGVPGTYLVMALAGGGGLLLGAVACHVAVVRRRRQVDP